jgi:transcriptional regulator with XRE-family HTH domain
MPMTLQSSLAQTTVRWYKPMILTSKQCRGARELVGMPQLDLAKRSLVSLNTIIDFEASERAPTAGYVATIQRALEAAGVEFVDAQPGVRLKGKDGDQFRV